MSEFSDFLTRNDDLISKVNEAILYSDFHEIKEVYIDLALLKDTRLGTILAEDKNTLPYITEHIPQYNIRPVRDFTFAFPKLKAKENTYRQMYMDPKYSKTIFNYSPDTLMYKYLPQMIDSVISSNARIKSDHRVKFTINTYPVQLSEIADNYKKILTLAIKDRVDVELICTDQHEITAQRWQNYGMLFLDDISYAFSPAGKLHKPLFLDGTMGLVKIYAPYCCDESILRQWQRFNVNFSDRETVRLMFEATEKILNAICSFAFMSFDIIS